MKFVIAISLAIFLIFLSNFQNTNAVKSFINRVNEYEISKLNSNDDLQACDEKEQKFLLLHLLNIANKETTAMLLQQRELSDRFFRSELLQKNTAKTLILCQENENKLISELAQCRKEKAYQMEPITSSFNRNLKNVYKELVPFLAGTGYPGFEKYTIISSARLGLLPLTYAKSFVPELNLGPILNDFNELSNTLNYQMNIPPIEKNTPNSRSIFIAVLSAPSNFEKRTKIRETWKTHIDVVKKKGVVTTIHFAFVLGKTENNSSQIKITEEMAKYKDIVQISELQDSPQNQTLKMIGVLKLIQFNCPTIDFLIKVNDDMYVNVHYLAFFVKKYYQIGKMTIYGDSTNTNYEINFKVPNNNGPKKNDAIMLDAWPWNSYPNYINGSAYFIHGTAILPLLAAIQTTPIIPYEDIYLTGICAEKAGVKTQYSTGQTCVSLLKYKDGLQLDPRLFITWKDDKQLAPMNHYIVNNFYTKGRVMDEHLEIKFQNNVSYFQIFPAE